VRSGRSEVVSSLPIAKQVQVGVVTLVFGQFGHTIEEFHGRHEVLDDPLAANSLSIVGQFPSRQTFKQSFYLVFWNWRYAAFARLALLGRQFFRGYLTH
jgi:hypothetical protein